MRILPLLFLGTTALSAFADSVTIPPSADACLFELNPDFNFGSDETFPVGTLGEFADGANTRGLFKFDVAGAVPAGATITAVTLTMRVTAAPGSSANSNFAFYPVFQDWGEGTGSGSGAGGRLALPGEATWDSRFHGSATWDEPGGELGGDFAEEASATQAVAGTGTYIFTFNADGLAAVQSMLDDPASNFGWVMASVAEGTLFTARRWATRENASPPQLAITFTAPDPPVEVPEVLSFALDHENGTGTLEFVRLAGLTHRLQRNPSLAPGMWMTVAELPPIVQDSVGIFEFAIGVDTHEFWRLSAVSGGGP